MSHAFVFWVNENKGDIIPIRDLRLTQLQKNIQEEVGGLGHLVGSTLKARFGENYFDAKVLQIGSSKELSEAEETLFSAEMKERSNLNRKRRTHLPTRFAARNSKESDSEEDDIGLKRKKWESTKKMNEILHNNQNETFSNIIDSYNKTHLETGGIVANDSSYFPPTSQVLAEANHVLNDEEERDHDDILDLDNQQEDKENDPYENLSRLELIQEVEKLKSKVAVIESAGCPRCAKQKPPQQVKEYLKSLIDEAVIDQDEREPSKLPPVEKVPLLDGYNILVTKPQKVAILVEGRRTPQKLISKVLQTFYSEEELGAMCYNGKKENEGMPGDMKDCLNGLLMKYHPSFTGVSKIVNRICCNARYRWRQKAGLQHPGDSSKYTPKQKRCKSSALDAQQNDAMKR